MCHVVCAVAIDSQDGVTGTQVTLGCLAARSYLKINIQKHTCTHASPNTPREKRKKKKRYVTHGVNLSLETKDKKRKEKIRTQASTQRPVSTEAALF